MKEEEEQARSSSEEEREKEEAKSTRRRSNAIQKGRKREKERERRGTKGSSTCDLSLHGLYFASWYLYLNSDGVTYEGGTRDEKRDRAQEVRRKPSEGEGRRKRGWREESDGARPGPLRCVGADSVIF